MIKFFKISVILLISFREYKNSYVILNLLFFYFTGILLHLKRFECSEEILFPLVQTKSAGLSQKDWWPISDATKTKPMNYYLNAFKAIKS